MRQLIYSSTSNYINFAFIFAYFAVKIKLTFGMSSTRDRILFANLKSYGGAEEFVASIGMGIDAGPVLVDLGTYNVESIFRPRGTTKPSGGLSIKFKVN